jgi:hypothetical protein
MECRELGSDFGRLRIRRDGFLERRLGALRVALRLEMPGDQKVVIRVGRCLGERDARKREQ